MAERAEQLGRRLPISISIGVDPAIEIGSCFEPPTTPLGYDELSVAGALRGEPVKLCRCLTVDELAIANAEYVIEGEVVPNVRIKEDQNTHTGFAMPEFPGYTGPASDQCWLIKVKAVTHRVHPIMQTCIGPSEEHVSMAGIPTEASIYGMVEKAMPGRLQNVYCCSAGGGKYMAVLQFKKSVASDEGRQRQAALLAFSAFSELKHIFLVDEDVDCFDMNDVLWAMNTRFQGDVDTITIPGVRCHPLDPSNDPAFSPSIRDHGIACKTIFDCTVPFDQKDRFVRARFMELDPSEWVKQENEGKIFMKSKGHNRGGKRIIVGATGASGLPILVKCLELIGEQPEYESYLIMSHSAVLTLGQETDLSAEQVEGWLIMSWARMRLEPGLPADPLPRKGC